MTLADVLKPSVQLLIHAETKGAQLGAGVGLAVALPGVAFLPNQFNSADAPPLVAVARVCGAAAVVGATAAVAVAVRRLTRLSKDELKQRADKLSSGESLVVEKAVCTGGMALGVALMAVRISKLARVQEQSALNTLMSKQCLWDCYCFAVMGSAVAVGVYKASQMAAHKICCMKNEDKQADKADDDTTATGEMQQVGDNVDSAVNEMASPEETVDKQQ